MPKLFILSGCCETLGGSLDTGPEAMNSVAASEQFLKPAVSVSRKFLFSTKTCLCVTEVEHHIHELGQQLARLCHVECRYMFDMTILFCSKLEIDRFLLTLLMSTIVNLTRAIARQVFTCRHVCIQVRSHVRKSPLFVLAADAAFLLRC